MTRILLVDDDEKLVPLLRRGLAHEGFEVYTAHDGTSGIETAHACRPHVVLLDIAMPGRDGFDVCRSLRLHEDAAIIMLTARDDVTDKVSALNLGADDYVAKPFAFDELVARIHTVLRRRKADGEPLQFADVTLNPATREVWRAERALELTNREYDILLLFMRHPRQVLTRDQILAQVWGYDAEADTNALDVHIGHVRQKLEAQDEPRLIQTVRGVGYSLRM